MTADLALVKLAESLRSSGGATAPSRELDLSKISLSPLPSIDISTPINFVDLNFPKGRSFLVDRALTDASQENMKEARTASNHLTKDGREDESLEESAREGGKHRTAFRLLKRFLNGLESFVRSLAPLRLIESATSYTTDAWNKVGSYFNKPPAASDRYVPTILIVAVGSGAEKAQNTEKPLLKPTTLLGKGGEASTKSRDRKRAPNGFRIFFASDEVSPDVFDLERAQEEEKKEDRREDLEEETRRELAVARDTLLDLAERFEGTRNDPRVAEIVAALGTPYDVLERSKERLLEIQKEVAAKA